MKAIQQKCILKHQNKYYKKKSTGLTLEQSKVSAVLHMSKQYTPGTLIGCIYLFTSIMHVSK
jgi:hypothetical protein